MEALPPIILTFSDTPRNRTRNEWLGARFKEVFGDELEVELKPVEATTYTAKQKDKSSDLQMFLGGWCADYPDPQNWLSVYFNGKTTFAERIGYNSKAFNTLTEQADKELNPAKRTQLYAAGAGPADQGPAGGLLLEQRELLSGQAVGERHQDHLARLRLAGFNQPAHNRHR